MTPPMLDSDGAEQEATLEIAKLMLVAARTAPKSGGVDDVLTLIVLGKEKDAIADKMQDLAEERKAEAFNRDAKNVRDSFVIVLVGVRGTKAFGINCAACGYESCEEFDAKEKKLGRDFIGPTCLLKALDLGIALGSAAKTAAELNVDNRIMFRIGTAAMKLNLMPEATLIIGIPLSVRGKSIYFDRPVKT